MAVITYPLGPLVDDAGTVLSAPVVTKTSVTDKSGSVIASDGATINGSATATPISVDYDAEAHGEAWITLAVSQAGHTITGLNAAPAIYCAKDSSRLITGVNVSMTQVVPTSNTPQTVGDALNAARAQGFGVWITQGLNLTLFAADGSTPVRSFTLDNPVSPTQRV